MVANGTMASCHRVTKNDLVEFSKLKEKMNFLVFGEDAVGLLIGIPEINNLNAYVSLGGRCVDFILLRAKILSKTQT